MRLGTILSLLKNLSITGKAAVIIAVIGAVGAFAAPYNSPSVMETSSAPIPEQRPKTQPTRSTVTTKTITEEQSIPFKKVSIKDSSLARGKTVIQTHGVLGKKVISYKLTLVGDKKSKKIKISEKVILTPVDQVMVVGTYVYVVPKPQSIASSNCDPNYTGACVPVASDVDCSGGSGNGPAYVSGPVRVVGSDIYGLDRDGDGYGCD